MRHRLVLAVAGLALAAGARVHRARRRPVARHRQRSLSARQARPTRPPSRATRRRSPSARPPGTKATAPGRDPRQVGHPARDLQRRRRRPQPRTGGCSCSQTTGYGQPLRAKSGFVVGRHSQARRDPHDQRSTATSPTTRISPNGRTLYLIEHFSNADVLRYRVRAYDLQGGPPPAADHRRQARAERADERHAVGARRDRGRPQGVHALRRPGAPVRPPARHGRRATRSASTCRRRPTRSAIETATMSAEQRRREADDPRHRRRRRAPRRRREHAAR